MKNIVAESEAEEQILILATARSMGRQQKVWLILLAPSALWNAPA
jgi:hypothetical protein